MKMRIVRWLSVHGHKARNVTWRRWWRWHRDPMFALSIWLDRRWRTGEWLRHDGYSTDPADVHILSADVTGPASN